MRALVIVGVVAALAAAVVALLLRPPAVPLPGGDGPAALPTAGPAAAVATTTTAVPDAGPVAWDAAFVGAAVCATCHPDAATAWRGSQHAVAMQPANETTVLGDFADATLTHAGATTTFARKDGRFVVTTGGPDGTRADFPIAYTFGVFPLQQYLVPFPDGRMQALTIAWDARPAAEGGQRWFHLYPDEPNDHRDELHWTKRAHNWNYACADCHSTNLRRRYDAAADRYATTWTDLAVACEACHGPGSAHVAWAKGGAAAGAAGMGLVVALDERRDVGWLPNADGNATRTRALASHREVEACAVCHARRSTLGDDPGPTGRLLDGHAPALLEARFYHPDGQQLDEVYTYGSFLQSKMYAAGVTCSDCHEPHSGAVRAGGNALCASCHAPAKYDTAAHHLHPAESAGAACVACHMPTRTYMRIDPRHDHSLRVPRPDLTVALGVPNACNGCHADRDAAWAAAAIVKAHGPERTGFQQFAGVLVAARSGQPGAFEGLARVIGDPATPAIARATAVAELPRYPSQEMLALLMATLGDPEPIVRRAALAALDVVPPPVRAPLADALAEDPVRGVRVLAGRMLAGVPADAVPAERREIQARAKDDYVASQRALAELPESHTNLGSFFAEDGDSARAETELRAALARDPAYAPAWANLADLYRALGREADAAQVLTDGLAATDDDPSLLHALGLARVRAQRLDDAVPLLGRAAAARPNDTRFAYVLGVALHEAGRRAEARRVLDAALVRAPHDRDLLSALAAFARAADDRAAARRYAERLVALAPGDPAAAALLEALREE